MPCRIALTPDAMQPPLQLKANFADRSGLVLGDVLAIAHHDKGSGEALRLALRLFHFKEDFRGRHVRKILVYFGRGRMHISLAHRFAPWVGSEPRGKFVPSLR